MSLGQFAPELRAEPVQLPIRGVFVIDLVAVEPRNENVVETAHAAKKYVLVFCGQLSATGELVRDLAGDWRDRTPWRSNSAVISRSVRNPLSLLISLRRT